jgi:hypothetical protein
MLLFRLIGLLLALIQGSLLVRLLLPFVDVPRGLRDYVPPLLNVTDLLIAPFRVLISPYDLGGSFRVTGAGDLGSLGKYVDKIDPAVLVAMVGWGIAGGLLLFILRNVIRPGA